MAKMGKLTKIKSAIKKIPSFTKQLSFSSSSSMSCSRAAIAAATEEEEDSSSHSHKHEVFVGKSRRRYCLSSNVINHPLFQELVERSSTSAVAGGDEVVVACEVVLFEHLVWLINESGCGDQLGSMQELVEFYTYSN